MQLTDGFCRGAYQIVIVIVQVVVVAVIITPWIPRYVHLALPGVALDLWWILHHFVYRPWDLGEPGFSFDPK